MKMDEPELLADYLKPQSDYERQFTLELIQAMRVKAERKAAAEALRWDKVAVGISAVAAVISLVALISG